MPRTPRTPSPVLALIPDELTVPALRRAAATCTGCDLHADATQTVFGEQRAGDPAPTDRVQVMFVGEQPGDQEDKTGHPFVGPAGQLFDRALADAGIDRDQAYVTNTVKHFKWEPRGRLRLHKKPNAEEIHACRPWLDAEIQAVRPRVLVLLGSTAAQALLGASFRVTQSRGQWIDSDLAPLTVATVHPSSILRAPDEDAKQRAYTSFVADLAMIAAAIRGEDPGARKAEQHHRERLGGAATSHAAGSDAEATLF